MLLSHQRITTGSIDVKDLAADQTYTKDITISATQVADAIKAANAKTSQVKKAVAVNFTLNIAESATWGFADVSSGEIVLDGVVIGTYSGGTTGKVAVFLAPTTSIV